MSSESSKYDCEMCHTLDMTKYTKTGFKMCRDCKLIVKNRPYLCEICLDNNKDNFEIGRYKKCKKCRNKDKKVSEVCIDILRRTENTPLDKDLNDQIRKHIITDHSIFGFTVKNHIETNLDIHRELTNENKLCKNKIMELQHEVAEVQEHLGNKFYELEKRNNDLEKRNNDLEKRLEFIMSKFSL